MDSVHVLEKIGIIYFRILRTVEITLFNCNYLYFFHTSELSPHCPLTFDADNSRRFLAKYSKRRLNFQTLEALNMTA